MTGYQNATIGQTFETAFRSTISVTMTEEPDVPIQEGGPNSSRNFGIALAVIFLIIVAVIWWYRTSHIKDREPDDRTRKGITHQD